MEGQIIEQVDQMSFPFCAPFGEVLVKGVEEDGRWVVYLEASNEIEDQDGETVDMAALEKAADYYLSHGILSWDHKHKQNNDPESIIGEPLEVKFTDDKRTLVKGWLYQHNDKAKKVWNNIRSGAERLGSSIGGGILRKASDRIRRVVWDEVAITHKPINDGTLGSVSMIPFSAFAKAISYSEGGTSLEEFVKALTAGSGVDAANFTGGRALTPESLQGSTVNIIHKDELDQLFGDMLKSIMTGDIANTNDAVNFVLDQGYSEGVTREIISHVAKNLSLR